MALSKSRRIQILLVIDSVFFLIELIIGYTVHSLALVADSFHMLNDVLSLCVGLWAVKVAGNKTRSKMYTYGWQRAETLGALVNGVFLVALCMSIFLEAIQRFFEPQEVSHPLLVLIVGCFGLASNIVGLFLFHDHGHGHSHGGDAHGHSHGSQSTIIDAEEGRAQKLLQNDGTSAIVADENGNIADVLPQARVGNWPTSELASSKHVTYGSTKTTDGSAYKITSPSSATRYRRRSRSRSRALSAVEDMPIHPASFRNEIIAASLLDDGTSAESSDLENEQAVEVDGTDRNGHSEGSPLLPKNANGKKNSKHAHSHSTSNGVLHKSHNHNKPRESGGGGGHSHADLNMRGVFLHVMGDALGNIGVIASALFIWLTDFWWRFYSDPLISLIITVIILCSAIPLCKAASRILLQAVPTGLNVDDIEEDITNLPNVVSCHHMHVWQLSDTKLVASLHVQVAFEFKGEGSRRYMELARQIRKCLHEYGIHSSTIQPEFCCEAEHGHRMVEQGNGHGDLERDSEGPSDGQHGCDTGKASGSEQPACLLDCDDDCAEGGQCCPSDANKGTQRSSRSASDNGGHGNSHEHGDGHGHAH